MEKLEQLELERARKLDQKSTVGLRKAVSHARRLIEDDEEVIPGTVTESQSKKEDQSPGLTVVLNSRVNLNLTNRWLTTALVLG